jgi:hypothetical protein
MWLTSLSMLEANVSARLLILSNQHTPQAQETRRNPASQNITEPRSCGDAEDCGHGRGAADSMGWITRSSWWVIPGNQAPLLRRFLLAEKAEARVD